MKISIPKPPAASRPAEPPAKGGNTGIVPPKGGNTGIVPPKGTNTGIVPPKGTNTGIVPPGATQPADGFQPATPTAGKGGTSQATGTSATSLTGTSSTTTYALSPKLEQFRELFDKEGERIANMPIQAQPGQIEATSRRLYEQLKDFGTLDEITSGVKASVEYYSSRRSTGDDPMTYALAAESLGGPETGGSQSAEDKGGDFGASFNPGPSSSDEGRLPRFGRRQQQAEEGEITQRFRRMRRFF